MNTQALIKTANALVADDKGILAMDDRNGTCSMRFAALGIAQTTESWRAYRDLLVTTPQLPAHFKRFSNHVISSAVAIRNASSRHLCDYAFHAWVRASLSVTRTPA